MTRCLSKPYLRRMRNEIPIRNLIADVLQISWKISEGRFRFVCPRCHDFNTATNPKTNLARCFGCQENFNPIDITMIHNRCDFLEAVAFLDQYLPKADRPMTTSATLDSRLPGHLIRDR